MQGTLRVPGKQLPAKIICTPVSRLRHFSLSHAKWPCIFRFFHSAFWSTLLHLITSWHAPASFPELAIFLIHSTNCKLPMFKTNPEYSDCHCSREQIITGKKPNSAERFRPSLTQDSQIQRYRDSTGKAVHPGLPGSEPERFDDSSST